MKAKLQQDINQIDLCKTIVFLEVKFLYMYYFFAKLIRMVEQFFARDSFFMPEISQKTTEKKKDLNSSNQCS